MIKCGDIKARLKRKQFAAVALFLASVFPAQAAEETNADAARRALFDVAFPEEEHDATSLSDTKRQEFLERVTREWEARVEQGRQTACWRLGGIAQSRIGGRNSYLKTLNDLERVLSMLANYCQADKSDHAGMPAD